MGDIPIGGYNRGEYPKACNTRGYLWTECYSIPWYIPPYYHIPPYSPYTPWGITGTPEARVQGEYWGVGVYTGIGWYIGE